MSTVYDLYDARNYDYSNFYNFTKNKLSLFLYLMNAKLED